MGAALRAVRRQEQGDSAARPFRVDALRWPAAGCERAIRGLTTGRSVGCRRGGEQAGHEIIGGDNRSLTFERYYRCDGVSPPFGTSPSNAAPDEGRLKAPGGLFFR